MKTFRDYLREAGEKKKQQLKDKDADWSAFDNLFGTSSDSNLPSAPEPERRDEPRDEPQGDAPQQRRASQADTHRATRNIEQLS